VFVRFVEIALAVVLCASFMVIGLAKLMSAPFSLVVRDRVRMGPVVWKAIGAAEVAGAFGVVIGAFAAPNLGAAAAGGLALVGLGALARHVQVRDSAVAMIPPAVLGVLAIVEASLLALHP
jgi:hypothetical protein